MRLRQDGLCRPLCAAAVLPLRCPALRAHMTALLPLPLPLPHLLVTALSPNEMLVLTGGMLEALRASACLSFQIYRVDQLLFPPAQPTRMHPTPSAGHKCRPVSGCGPQTCCPAGAFRRCGGGMPACLAMRATRGYGQQRGSHQKALLGATGEPQAVWPSRPRCSALGAPALAFWLGTAPACR